MPAMPKTYTQIVEALQLVVPNKGQRFITAEHERLALNQAALFVASELGGITYWVDIPIVADQNDYLLESHIIQIPGPIMVMDTTTSPENNEGYIDVMDFQDFHAQKDRDAILTSSGDMAAWFRRDTGVLHIEPALTDDTKVLRVLCKGYPQEIDTTATLYDGDASQMNALVFEAASILRMRSRDHQESTIFHQRAVDAIEYAAQIQSRANQIKRIKDGQVTPLNRLRSI